MAASSPRKRAAVGTSAPETLSNVKSEDLIAFTNAAAGHEGVLSNASGSLIYKPCTAAEIAFYESAANHPRFQALIPAYMGTLNAPSDPKQAAALAAAIQQAGDPATALPITPEVLQQTVGKTTTGASTENSKSEPAQEWAPSASTLHGHAISTSTSIVLQNVAQGFSHPNILDLKLGARLWDDAAPEAKRARLDEVSQATTSGSLGFRIAGMKVYDPEKKLEMDKHVELKEDGYRSYDKYYGRSFKGEEDIRSAFDEFLSQAGEGKQGVAKRFLADIRNMQETLEHQESRMYSASVLMVFEGEQGALNERLQRGKEAKKSNAKVGVSADAQEDEDEEEFDDLDDEDAPPSKVSDAKLIDFAHATWTPGQGPDENSLQGVRSIVRILEKIVGK